MSDSASLILLFIYMSEKEREILLRNYEETLPPNLPEPPKSLVELAREKKNL